MLMHIKEPPTPRCQLESQRLLQQLLQQVLQQLSQRLLQRLLQQLLQQLRRVLSRLVLQEVHVERSDCCALIKAREGKRHHGKQTMIVC